MSNFKQYQSIGGFDFEGPYSELKNISEREGLFAIVCVTTRQYYLLDIGYSSNINKACQSPVKMECWKKHKIGNISYAFYVDDDFNGETYMIALDALKKQYKKCPCID